MVDPDDSPRLRLGMPKPGRTPLSYDDSFQGIPIRAVNELTPEPGVTYRWDVAWGQYTIGGSRLNRWRLKWCMFRYRARDAWGVLTGKLEVNE